MHGKDSNIPKGTEITGYVNGEIKLNSASMTAPLAESAATNLTNTPLATGERLRRRI